MKNCINCNKTIDNNSEFCSSCGTAQPKINNQSAKCAYCGKPIKSFEEQCGYCGAYVEIDSASSNPFQSGSEATVKMEPTDAFAIVSLICGIISVVLSWIPLIGFIFCCIGIVFGILGIKGKRKKFSIVGITLSSISLVINVLFIASCIYIGTLP